MEPISAIEWGPVDANARDPNFLKKYIEESNFKNLLSKGIPIVTGDKGSGKSALVQGLNKKHKQEYTHFVNFSFDDDIATDAIVSNIYKVCETASIDKLKLMAGSWEYAILISCMKEVVEGVKLPTITEKAIISYLKAENVIQKSLTDVLIDSAIKIWGIIEKYTANETTSQSDQYPGVFSPDLMSEIRNLPLSNLKFIKIKKLFVKYISDKNLKILVTLDNLDMLRVESIDHKTNIDLIFYGLVHSVYKIATSDELGENIFPKAVVPYDIWISVNMRDRDKYDPYCKKISWTKGSLMSFLRQRISVSLNSETSLSVDMILNEVFQNNIFNDHVGIEEKTFDYILRHTLYRPRHFQIHLSIFSQDYEGKVATGELLRRSIEKSSKLIVGYWLEEHFLNHPRLKQIIKSFRHKSNILEYGVLYDFMGKVLLHMGLSNYSVTTKLNQLYLLGFLGLKVEVDIKNGLDVQQQPRKPYIEPYTCQFQYSHPNSTITDGLSNNVEFVIHPLFVDYCELRPSRELLIG